MIPIFEQGRGRGIGHSRRSFEKRFEEICEENPEKSFAFIFYDFRDHTLRQILKDQGVFAKLDRLSGTRIDIFFFHGSKRETAQFNRIFLEKLGIKDSWLPCVVFFRLVNGAIADLSVAALDNANLIHGFAELQQVIENYIDKKPESNDSLTAVRYLMSASRFIALESFKDLLKILFDRMPFLH